MLKLYTTILLFFSVMAIGLTQNNSIRIQRTKTCITPAYEILNHCVIEPVEQYNRSYVRIYLFTDRDWYSNEKLYTHKNVYYAHKRPDSTISHRKVRWKRARYRDNPFACLYVQIKTEDFNIHQLYYKKDAKVCDECGDREEIIYLDESVNQEIKEDGLVHDYSTFIYPLFRPNKVKLRIHKAFISEFEKYYTDSLGKNPVAWETKKFGKKNYYFLTLDVERSRAGTKLAPIVYRRVAQCPSDTLIHRPNNYVLSNRYKGNYFSGWKADIGARSPENNYYLSFGYHKKLKLQSINLSLQYASTRLLTPRFQYQFYFLNLRSYNHLSYHNTHNSQFYIPHFTQGYLGAEIFYRKQKQQILFTQRYYLGFNQQYGYVNFFINGGYALHNDQSKRMIRYLEFGVKYNLPKRRDRDFSLY